MNQQWGCEISEIGVIFGIIVISICLALLKEPPSS